jgi:hypothetical protein
MVKRKAMTMVGSFKVCTLNFKRARKKKILSTNVRKRFSKSFIEPPNSYPI